MSYGLSLGEGIVTLFEYQPATFSLQVNFGESNFAPPADLADALINARAAIENSKVAGVGMMLSYSLSPRFTFFEDLDMQGDALGFDDGSGTVGGYLSAAF